MMKAEDDCLNDIDAFCNEVLLPRLNDGGSIAGGDTAGVMDTLVKAVANAQKDFLVDLNALSKQIKEQADNLDKRANAHQQRVDAEFAMTLNRMREDMTNAMKDSVKTTTDYTRALASGIQSLNTLLSELGGKQIMIHQVKKKGWFSNKEPPQPPLTLIYRSWQSADMPPKTRSCWSRFWTFCAHSSGC
jgi:hypothetical protein